MANYLNPINRQQAFVRFQNNTCYSVEAIWINVINTEKIYKVLSPKSFLDVNTYSMHSWIFREYVSKSQMVVAGKEIFKPKPWVEEIRRLEFNHPISVPLRTIVVIDMPVLDLRQLCLLKLANILKSKNDLSELELPKVLQIELTQMISNKNKLIEL